MKNQKGIIETMIVIVLGFAALWVWRAATYRDRITCQEYQEILNKGERPASNDKSEHYYHGHKRKAS